MDTLGELAELLKQQNVIAEQITRIIKRPAQRGHIGEYIAASIFDITLMQSAVHRSLDGHFNQGSLAGKSVNIKWYGKWEGLLDITPALLPDYYLVLTGIQSLAVSSRGAIRPHVIEYVFLFDARTLYKQLVERKIRIGIATSVIQRLWQEAELYPKQNNETIPLTDEQRRLLALFR